MPSFIGGPKVVFFSPALFFALQLGYDRECGKGTGTCVGDMRGKGGGGGDSKPPGLLPHIFAGEGVGLLNCIPCACIWSPALLFCSLALWLSGSVWRRKRGEGERGGGGYILCDI